MLGKHHHLCLTSKPAAPKWLQLVAAAWRCHSLLAAMDGDAAAAPATVVVAMAFLHHGTRSGNGGGGVILLFAARRCEYRVLRGVPFESRLRNQCLCSEHAGAQ